MKPEGLNANLIEENLELTLEDQIGEEYLLLPALELAEALARLEEKPPLFMAEVSDESEGISAEPQMMEHLPQPWQPPFPDAQQEATQEGYRAAEVAMIEPPEMLLVRRLFVQGEDLLEFDTPSGSVYGFPYTQALSYLREFLPR